MRVIPSTRTKGASPTLILQSDDWGFFGFSPNPQWSGKLITQLPADLPPWQARICSDTIETAETAGALFSILSTFRDEAGNPPCLQAGVVVGFPDHEKMEGEGFVAYRDRFLPESPRGWPEWKEVVPVLRKARAEGVFRPFYHGRSHFAVRPWMEALRSRDSFALQAFREGAVPPDFIRMGEYGRANLPEPLDEWLEGGMKGYRELFGEASLSTVPPVYIWTDAEEKAFVRAGIACLQGKNRQVPWAGPVRRALAKARKAAGWKDSARFNEIGIGDRNAKGLVYLTRNVTFEPLMDQRKSVAKAIFQARRAWERGDPAIVCTHRFNYCTLDEAQRKRSLNQLQEFLRRILEEQPRLRFATDESPFPGDGLEAMDRRKAVS